jgi:hypothetical protein
MKPTDVVAVSGSLSAAGGLMAAARFPQVSNLDQHEKKAFLTSISIVNRVEKGSLRGCRQKESLDMVTTKSGGSKRGFAAMDPAKQREIASKGGKASHGGGRKAASGR